MASFIDTNCILRYLLDDPQAPAVEKLLKSGKKLRVPDIVIAEVIWVLLSFYGWEKHKIIRLVSTILQLDNIQANIKLIFNALLLYDQHNIDYIDAYLVALMKQKKTNRIYSFDRHFDKIPDITRLKP